MYERAHPGRVRDPIVVAKSIRDPLLVFYSFPIRLEVICSSRPQFRTQILVHQIQQLTENTVNHCPSKETCRCHSACMT